MPGKLLFFGGFAIALGIQLYIVVLGFKKSLLHGFGCLIVPGYVLYFALRRDVSQIKAIFFWGAGIFFIIIGAYLLS